MGWLSLRLDFDFRCMPFPHPISSKSSSDSTLPPQQTLTMFAQIADGFVHQETRLP